jgi:hypothetical protein
LATLRASGAVFGEAFFQIVRGGPDSAVQFGGDPVFEDFKPPVVLGSPFGLPIADFRVF